MGWQGRLRVAYRREGEATRAHDRHEGPLRVLRALYPEGPGICQHVLVHPPGGLVGGDRLDMALSLAEGSHALVTTPGATRFYRSGGEEAVQTLHATLAEGARLEWLPLETLAYPGCRAANRLVFELAGSAQMIGWDLLALGLPTAGAFFETGRIEQQIELPGCWLERGVFDANDRLLLDSPLGLAGQRVLGSVWLAAGSAWPDAFAEAALDAARAAAAEGPAAALEAGATAAQPGLLVLRVLAARVEPAFELLRRVRAAWRRLAWDLPAAEPRIWRT